VSFYRDDYELSSSTTVVRLGIINFSKKMSCPMELDSSLSYLFISTSIYIIFVCTLHALDDDVQQKLHCE